MWKPKFPLFMHSTAQSCERSTKYTQNERNELVKMHYAGLNVHIRCKSCGQAKERVRSHISQASSASRQAQNPVDRPSTSSSYHVDDGLVAVAV